MLVFEVDNSNLNTVGSLAIAEEQFSCTWESIKSEDAGLIEESK